jgi:hypothetical protein
MRQLPLCGRVIFCDWHSVLSREALTAYRAFVLVLGSE